MLCIHALKGGSCQTKCHSLIKNANKNVVAFLFAKAERPSQTHVQRMSLLRFSITKQQRTKCLELCNVAPLREPQQPRCKAASGLRQPPYACHAIRSGRPSAAVGKHSECSPQNTSDMKWKNRGWRGGCARYARQLLCLAYWSGLRGSMF
jgi:hypothetical protein